MVDEQNMSTDPVWQLAAARDDSEIETLFQAAKRSSVSSLMPTPFDRIEAETLQQVLAYWREMRHGAEMPLMQNLDPAKMGRWLSHITIVEVQHDPLAFVYRLTGEKMQSAHGAGIKGTDVRSVNEAVPGLGDTLHLMNSKLVEYRAPCALRGDLVVKNPALKGMELLILPVSLTGEKVDRLLNVAKYYERSLMPLEAIHLVRA